MMQSSSFGDSLESLSSSDSAKIVEQARAELERGGRYDSAAVIAIRNAAKLGAKFLKEVDTQNVAGYEISMSVRAFDVGLTLALVGAREKVIVAGLLNNAYDGHLVAPLDKIKAVVTRKFGSEVSELIEAISEPSATGSRSNWLCGKMQAIHNLEEGDRDVGMLSCAIKISLLKKANDLIQQGKSTFEVLGADAKDNKLVFEVSMGLYAQVGVPTPLLKQFHCELERFAELTGEKVSALPLLSNSGEVATENERQFMELLNVVSSIRQAAEFSAELFSGVNRKWGPEEKMSLFSHQFEVGMLLALSGQRREVVIAGFLHDIFEGYTKHDPNLLKAQVEKQFGERVVDLIEAVTEPAKGEGNFWERKLAVLNKLKEGDLEMATLSCATKISTIAAGNKFLWMGRDVNEWSAGSHADNLVVFQKYFEVYEQMGVSQELLTEYKREMERFQRGASESDKCGKKAPSSPSILSTSVFPLWH